MKINNIYNKGRKVYLFGRDDSGKLTITEDNSLYPYYYELAKGDHDVMSFDGKPLKKLFVTNPSDIRKQRSHFAYEADIIFSRRYMIDKVDSIEQCPIKYAFIDIETLSTEIPDVQKAKFPIGCISVYNSETKSIQTFVWGHTTNCTHSYNTEFEMIEGFIDYMKKEQFDLWLSWNVNFDYDYMFHRVPDLAKKLSPIHEYRYGHDDVQYPAGISILDYLGWFKKVTLNKAKSYALDSVGEEYLGKGKTYKKVDFSVISDELLLRNQEDVQMMANLEDKYKIISYYDEVRRLAKVEWEDLLWNSRIIDMLVLREAKEKGTPLPMKSNDNEEGTYEGAYREAYELGANWNIGKYDLASAYPNMVVDFCLDPSNILDVPNTNSITIEGTHFHQNDEAVLSSVVKKLMKIKDSIKKELNQADPNAPEYKTIDIKYSAIKTIVNSAYGVMGNRFFRLYDPRVASAITFLVRDVLHHVKDELDKKEYNVIYVDTDSVFIKHEDNLNDLLNDLIMDWACKYEKPEVSTKFDYEGHFEKLLILAKCRYIGYVKTANGLKEEIKGVEMKRKDSTEFMKKFQKEIVHKILDKTDKRTLQEFIKVGVENLRNAQLKEIAFPCKISKKIENYKNLPIFVRAVQETDGFDPKMGEDFFYIYVEPVPYTVENEVTEYYIMEPGKREGKMRKKKLSQKALKEMDDVSEVKSETKIKKTKKYEDVKAFDEYSDTHEFKIDWNKMIDRNIWNKLDVIFTAMGWDIEEAKDYAKA